MRQQHKGIRAGVTPSEGSHTAIDPTADTNYVHLSTWMCMLHDAQHLPSSLKVQNAAVPAFNLRLGSSGRAPTRYPWPSTIYCPPPRARHKVFSFVSFGPSLLRLPLLAAIDDR